MTIHFDLDGTLLDTHFLIEAIKVVLIQHFGWDKEQLTIWWAAYVSTLPTKAHFDSLTLSQFLAQKSGQALSEIRALFNVSILFKAAIFNDALATLPQLSTYKLAIWTQGHSDWQSSKLQLSGLLSNFTFKPIVITKQKTTLHATSHFAKGDVVVDDKLDILESIDKSIKITKIFLNREQQPVLTKLSQINSLTQLPRLLQSKHDTK